MEIQFILRERVDFKFACVWVWVCVGGGIEASFDSTLQVDFSFSIQLITKSLFKLIHLEDKIKVSFMHKLRLKIWCSFDVMKF